MNRYFITIVSLILIPSQTFADYVDITLFNHNSQPYSESLDLNTLKAINTPYDFNLYSYDVPLPYDNPPLIKLLSLDKKDTQAPKQSILSHTRWQIPSDDIQWRFSLTDHWIHISTQYHEKFEDILLTVNYNDTKNPTTLRSKQRVKFDKPHYFDHHSIGVMIQLQHEDDDGNLLNNT